jgi:hypothetical protein
MIGGKDIKKQNGGSAQSADVRKTQSKSPGLGSVAKVVKGSKQAATHEDASKTRRGKAI